MKRLAGKGRTAAVELSMEDAERAIAGYEDRLAVAGSNAPAASVLSGAPDALEEVLGRLRAKGVFGRELRVDVAFHSPQMGPLVPEIEDALAAIKPRAAAVPLYSTVTAGRIDGLELDARYWGRNLREPFRFSQTIERMIGDGHVRLLEVGPHPVLSHSIEQNLQRLGREGQVFPSLHRNWPDRDVMLRTLGALFTGGHAVTWPPLEELPASAAEAAPAHEVAHHRAAGPRDRRRDPARPAARAARGRAARRSRHGLGDRARAARQARGGLRGADHHQRAARARHDRADRQAPRGQRRRARGQDGADPAPRVARPEGRRGHVPGRRRDRADARALDLGRSDRGREHHRDAPARPRQRPARAAPAHERARRAVHQGAHPGHAPARPRGLLARRARRVRGRARAGAGRHPGPRRRDHAHAAAAGLARDDVQPGRAVRGGVRQALQGVGRRRAVAREVPRGGARRLRGRRELRRAGDQAVGAHARHREPGRRLRARPAAPRLERAVRAHRPLRRRRRAQGLPRARLEP